MKELELCFLSGRMVITLSQTSQELWISKTNIMYHREKANWSIVYTKNKFYYITNHYRQGKKIKLFNYSHLTLMSTNHGLMLKLKTILNIRFHGLK
jgi:hypothetical protein